MYLASNPYSLKRLDTIPYQNSVWIRNEFVNGLARHGTRTSVTIHTTIEEGFN